MYRPDYEFTNVHKWVSACCLIFLVALVIFGHSADPKHDPFFFFGGLFVSGIWVTVGLPHGPKGQGPK